MTPFKGLRSYKNVAFELLDWANLLAEYVSVTGGRLSPQELTEAKRLGERLVEPAGHREQAPPDVAVAAHIPAASRSRMRSVEFRLPTGFA